MEARMIVQQLTRADLRAIVGLTARAFPNLSGKNGRKRILSPTEMQQLRQAAWGELEARKRNPGLRGGK